MSELTLRDATHDDAEALAKMAHRAFRIGDGTGWGPYFRDNPHVRDGHTVLAHVDEDHAGNATALDLRMSIRGRDLTIAGVAAVATAPEFRRRGVAQAMLRALLHRAREVGTPWAMLYGISLAFYRKLGFGLAEHDALLVARGAQFPASPTYRAVRPWDRARDEAGVRAVYESQREGTTGQLVRGDYWWTQRVIREGVEGVVVREGGEVTGYALFEVPQEPEYPQQRVMITELRAATPFAWRALLGWADTLRNQYVEIRLLTAPGTALALLREHGVRDLDIDCAATADPFGLACAGVMARVADLDAAVRAHAYEGASRAVPLRVHDPLDGVPQDLDLIAEGEGLRVETSRAGGERLSVPVDALSTVILGATRAETLRAMGLLEGAAQHARALDALFPPTEVHLGQRNHF
ncbi:MAG: GNAT family N-acetyltransferase [Polyangiales bacterium]